jgi:PKD repeat protein
VKDPVFFFCSVTGNEKAVLYAQRPGVTGNYDFTWYKWNDAAGAFSIFVRADNGVDESNAPGLDQGGYRVMIDSLGVQVAVLTGWVFFDTKPIAEASLQQQLCNRVALRGRAEAGTSDFFYRDPLTAASVNMKNSITFRWSSDPSSVIPYPDIEINPVTYTPPLEDVTYRLTVNSLGCSNDSSFFYESIHVKADFSVDPVQGEAPLEVSFTDRSIRADIYKWDYGDDTISYLKDPLPHTYYKPGEYTVLLTIESNLNCIDSLRSQKIVVDPSAIDIPNVFTPDGDTWNDKFAIDATSMRYVSMEIFSQSGQKVYAFSGDGERLKNWEGWDGKINNSSIEARPGIYFYVIRAFGWDDVRYDGKEYRGFVYLYR